MPRIDPYRNFKFRVSFSTDPNLRMGFSSVSGLSEETTAIEYREGNTVETPLKIPGQTSFDNIVLERGMGSNDFMLEWRKKVLDRNREFFQPPDNDFRCDVTITLHNKSGILVREWKVKNAWPTMYECDDLEADGDDVLIERVELAHEGLVHTSFSDNVDENNGFGG